MTVYGSHFPDNDPPSSRRLQTGDVIAGRYLLLESLAIGGMGEVWIARNLLTGAEVAAKVLLPMHAESQEGFARFRREARATAALSHRAIVRVFDLIELDEDRGPLVMVMELLRGQSLAKRLQHMGMLSIEETAQIAFPLLSALTHAHKLGIIHRDLKPENIVLAEEPDGTRLPKIVDFGVSKFVREHPITLEGQIVGTLSYMSPEQMRGEPVDERTDIFSMGVLLYECLSGRNPFASALNNQAAGGFSLYDFLAVLQVDPAPLTDIPGPLWEVIRRALAKDANDRYATTAELTDSFSSAILGYAPVLPLRPSTMVPIVPTVSIEPHARTSRRRVSSRVVATALLASLSLLAVASASSVVRSATHAPPRPVTLTAARVLVAPEGRGTVVAHAKRVAEPRDHWTAPPPPAPEEDPVTEVATHPSHAAPSPRTAPTSLAGYRLTPNGSHLQLVSRRLVAVVRDPGF